MKKGSKHSPLSIRRMSDVRKGRSPSAKTKAYLSESARKRNERIEENEALRVALETFVRNRLANNEDVGEGVKAVVDAAIEENDPFVLRTFGLSTPESPTSPEVVEELKTKAEAKRARKRTKLAKDLPS
jgi:hypothetical protein